MDTELSQLENQLEQLIGHYQAGKRELRDARARIAALEVENRKLAEKVGFASAKLESLLERLPDA